MMTDSMFQCQCESSASHSLQGDANAMQTFASISTTGSSSIELVEVLPYLSQRQQASDAVFTSNLDSMAEPSLPFRVNITIGQRSLGQSKGNFIDSLLASLPPFWPDHDDHFNKHPS